MEISDDVLCRAFKNWHLPKDILLARGRWGTTLNSLSHDFFDIIEIHLRYIETRRYIQPIVERLHREYLEELELLEKEGQKETIPKGRKAAKRALR